MYLKFMLFVKVQTSKICKNTNRFFQNFTLVKPCREVGIVKAYTIPPFVLSHPKPKPNQATFLYHEKNYTQKPYLFMRRSNVSKIKGKKFCNIKFLNFNRSFTEMNCSRIFLVFTFFSFLYALQCYYVLGKYRGNAL